MCTFVFVKYAPFFSPIIVEGLFKKKNKKKKNEEPAEEEVYVDDKGNVHVDNVEVSFEESEVPADVQPNTWLGRFNMETVEYKNGKERDRMTISFHMDTYKTAFIADLEDAEGSVIIFNKADGTMTTKTNSNGSKTAMVMKVPKVTVDADEAYNDIYSENQLPQATGDYRMIEGHRCQKYVYEDDEVQGEAWVTEDADFSMMDVFGAMNVNPSGQVAQPPKGSPYSFQSGMVLESTTIEKGKDRRTVMYMRDIEKDGQDTSLFDLKGYTVMKLPNVGGFMQKKN
jgi:ribosomal protein L24